MQFDNTKIGGMSFGSTKIGGAKYGNTLVFSPGGGAQPVMIPYIRGGADGSYIDTGITPDNTTRVIMWARNVNPTCGYCFGSRIAYNNQMFGLYINSNTNYIGSMCVAYGDRFSSGADMFRYLCGYHKYEINAGALYVDDTLVSRIDSPSFSGNSFNIFLFAFNNAGTYLSNSKPIDICSVRIIKNGSTVRNFIPAESPSVGLYDTVSRNLFTNAGGGSFTYGTFQRDSYIPLEYIGLSGEQYFDTGIRGSNSLPFVIKVTPKLSSLTYPQIFGARTSGTSKLYGLRTNDAGGVKGRNFSFMYNNDTIYYDYGSSVNDKTFVVNKRDDNVATLYQMTSPYPIPKVTDMTATAGTFATDYNIYFGALNNAGAVMNYYTGEIYHLSFGSMRNFVPAKVNDVAGMYETYNDVFYPSATATPFTAGPTL